MLRLEELLGTFVIAKLKDYDRMRSAENVRVLSRGEPVPDSYTGEFYKFNTMYFDYKEVKEGYRECLQISIPATRWRRHSRCVEDRVGDYTFIVNVTTRDFEHIFTAAEISMLRIMFNGKIFLSSSDGEVFFEFITRLKDYYIEKLRKEFGYTKDDIDKLTR